MVPCAGMEDKGIPSGAWFPYPPISGTDTVDHTGERVQAISPIVATRGVVADLVFEGCRRAATRVRDPGLAVGGEAQSPFR